MHTDIFSAGMSKSHLASIPSRPLFMRVAQSTVIFLPMDHLGCLNASSGVTASSLSVGRLRNGPPEAVSIILNTSSLLGPERARKAGEEFRPELPDLVLKESRVVASREGDSGEPLRVASDHLKGAPSDRAR